MSKEKLRVPKLRFPGFTEDWEQRKLGDVGMVKSGVGFPEKEQGGIEGIPFYKVSDMNHFDNQFEMIVANNYVSQNQIKKNRWSPITACSAIIFAKVGAAVLLDRKRLCTNSFMLDNNMMAYIVYPEQLNKYFCKFLFDTINLGNLIQVGALPSLNAKDISDIKKYIPNLSEQNRIAKLLLSVETLITLHQRKLEHLNLKKKALLQKLFPKNGERYPELRFPGFTDAWEQRKLSEVVIINPKTELPNEFKYVDLESVVGTNLLGFQVIKKENAPSRAQRLASYGDVFYQTVRPYQRNNYLFEDVDKDMVFSTGYAQLRSKLDSYFLLTLVQNDNFVKVVLDNCTGTSYPAINGSELGKINVQIPSNEVEANQIGKVFRGIDKNITLHQ